MKPLSTLLAGLALLSSATALVAQTPASYLAQAEDLWGTRVQLDSAVLDSAPTVVVPFSTSLCGYCLLDGYFVQANYLDQNDSFGGHSFHWCLFNPQLDVVAFQKHYGWTHPILTYPPELFFYQRTGYPTVLAFRKGRQLVRELHNYALVDTLGQILWRGRAHLTPTGPIQMATRLLYDNGRLEAVRVLPTGAPIPERARDLMRRFHSLVPKNLDQLTEQDLQKHLFFYGDFSFEALENLFRGRTLPVRFENHRVVLGPYTFDYDSTGFRFICPNPFNPQRYLFVMVTHGAPFLDYYHHLDYEFFRVRGDTAFRLVYGHFDRSSPRAWRFAPKRAFGPLTQVDTCGTRCPLPPPPPARPVGPQLSQASPRRTAFGLLYQFGDRACHFPDLLIDPDGNLWLGWDEHGDVRLVRLAPKGNAAVWTVEGDSTDSYNTRLAWTKDGLWVFYLNNRSGFYWLYSRCYDGATWSDELLVSPYEPYDVVSPAVVGSPTSDSLTVVWSAWFANLRIPSFRTLVGGKPGSRQRVHLHDPIYTKGYVNGWAFSLCRDQAGGVVAAWNQHYPSLTGVFAGNLRDAPQPVTRSGHRLGDWEIGGYPCLFGRHGELYVVWEGNALPVVGGQIQEIKIARYDPKRRAWTAGKGIPTGGQTRLNQTPVGAVDASGAIWVAYSGRPAGPGQQWGIYVTKREGKRWSPAQLVSPPGIPARAPRIAADSTEGVWLAWHEGTGEDVRISLLKLDGERFDKPEQ